MKDPETLQDIVPEYHSKNPVVRWLFGRRLEAALDLGGLSSEVPLQVLDLGCGEGAFLKLASAVFPAHGYAGWDFHTQVTGLQIPGVRFSRVDIMDPRSIPPGTFDRVFCLDVLEHFRELAPVLARIRGLLKSGGTLIISEPTESWLYRLGRLAVKGTLSAQEGPAAGPHYHDAAGVHRCLLEAGFQRQAITRIPFLPLDLFHVTRYGA